MSAAPSALQLGDETLQAVHAIYAWTKLLQLSGLDEAERSRALAVIEQNGQLLLSRLACTTT
jgi:hypothetical protein